MKNKKLNLSFWALYMDFSFLPQVVAAWFFYYGLRPDSFVLLDGKLQTAFLMAFAEITIFSVVTAIKHFYFTRFLLIAAYVQLVVTVFVFNFQGRIRIFGEFYHHANRWIFVYAAVGIVLAVINVICLMKYQKYKKLSNS
ncbi:MAG: hypothetical protein FWD34_02130 [Oscillospiraceae bacterium]|nr:hypothetical protein [Oscillospiraceae bacterium]